MTHITLAKKTNSKPCLEFYSDGNGEPRRITIEQFPFRIGRAESADLRVDSVEVSREHAEIFERSGMCLVRDLGSTNGTQVNGKPVKETLLADGDILKVAQTELTFIASAASQFQRMVTQPINAKKPAASPRAMPPEIAVARMIAEATLWQAIPTRLLAAVSMRNEVTDAYFLTPSHALDRQPALDQSSAVANRYWQVERMLAVESAVDHGEAMRLFVAVVAAEIESPQPMLESLVELRDLLPADWELGVTISLPADVDILRITDLYRQAREHSLSVAYDAFQGNGSQVMHLKSLLPDYLVLAPAMTKDVASSRQPMRRLESLLAACEELAIKPVLPSGDSGHGFALCQEIGYDLVLQAANRRSESKTPELSVTA